MDAQIREWLECFQRDKDADALEGLKNHCITMIEPLIAEFEQKYGTEAGDLLRERWDKRFFFIFTKYQLDVGLDLKTFVTNTYRFYFMQTLKKAGY